MSAASEVEIEEIAIDGDGHLLVRPRLPAEDDFAFIWRDASGIRWNETARALVAAEPQRWEGFNLYKQILAAVQSEYGKRLIVTAATRWSGVRNDLKERIQASA